MGRRPTFVRSPRLPAGVAGVRILAGMEPIRGQQRQRPGNREAGPESGLGAFADRAPFIGVGRFLEAVVLGHRPRVVDARGVDAAQAGRIPGAVALPGRELHPVSAGVRTVANTASLVARFTERGIGRDPVLVYGGRGGADAAHVWWTLHYLGHEAAFLLDGGIEAWLDAGHPLEDGPSPPPAPATRPLPSRPVPDRVITSGELKARLGEARLGILDARTPQEYGSSSGAHGTHIPGATLFTWSDALEPDGRLRDLRALTADLSAVLATDEVVTYCQSGVRAAYAYALLRSLGHPRPRLYMGSWAEWSRDPDAPREG